MILQTLEDGAQARHLKVLGGFHPGPADDVPEGCRTLILLGPDEPEFWPAFAASPEYRDGKAHPMDRWSTRVVGEWAGMLQTLAVFPFGGPPFAPFYAWALRTGRLHASPLRFLVHDVSGLLVSFRGALALASPVDLPDPPPPPCMTCVGRPCVGACPVDALTPDGYDVSACKAFLDTDAGQDCMDRGCAARRACPVSQRFGRLPVQSAFHMRSFKGA